jgi:SAM-dependent methyltransferase
MDAAEIERLYSDGYAAERGHGEDPAVEEAKRRTFRRWLPEPPHAGGRRLLDVGCSTGAALEVARGLGWEIHGIDLAAESIEAARARLPGADLRAGDPARAGFPPESFQAITLFDVLEHFPDPRAALEEIHGLLVPGGALVGITPDAGSLSARLLGSRWFHFIEEHLYYFDRRNIRRLLEESGFDEVRIRGARKCISLEMAYRHFRIHPDLGGAGLARALLGPIPPRLRRLSLWIPCGQLGFSARRPRLR